MSQERILELGYYHPTDRFRTVTEHIAVMDTANGVFGADGELVATFGPSRCGGTLIGTTPESVAQSEADARLFILAGDLLQGCIAAYHALRSYQYHNASPDLAAEIADHLAGLLAQAGIEPNP